MRAEPLASPRPLRVGFDASKLMATDGIGSFCRGLLRELLVKEPELGIEHHLYLLEQLPPGQVGRTMGEIAGRFGLNSGRIHAGLPVPEDGLGLFHVNTWLWPEGWQGPLLLTCYDLTFLTHAECHTLENKVRCLGGTLRALARGGHFLAISEATATEMRVSLGLGSEKIDVVYPAVGEDFVPLREPAAESPYLLTVGTLEPRKNLWRLVQALESLDPELRRRFPLWVVGGGGWLNEDLQRVREILPEVRFLGRVSQERLLRLYQEATLVLYPSLAEGFGLPVLEAMACGAPVLTSSVSSLPEVAGGAARLVDPLDVPAIGQAISDLLTAPEELAAMRQRGLERAREFSWRRAAGQVGEIYCRLSQSSRQESIA